MAFDTPDLTGEGVSRKLRLFFGGYGPFGPNGRVDMEWSFDDAFLDPPLTEAEVDQMFQDFVDWVTSYSGATPDGTGNIVLTRRYEMQLDEGFIPAEED